MRMANKQRGMTGIGWLTVLGLIAFFSLLALRMIPSYLEYYLSLIHISEPTRLLRRSRMPSSA